VRSTYKFECIQPVYQTRGVDIQKQDGVINTSRIPILNSNKGRFKTVEQRTEKSTETVPESVGQAVIRWRKSATTIEKTRGNRQYKTKRAADTRNG
jgi:hypothetical protein